MCLATTSWRMEGPITRMSGEAERRVKRRVEERGEGGKRVKEVVVVRRRAKWNVVKLWMVCERVR